MPPKHSYGLFRIFDRRLCRLITIAFFVMTGCIACVEDHLSPCQNKTAGSNIPGVDFVYLINLDRRPDRLASSLQQLQLYGISPYRFSAIDGKTLSTKALEDVGVRFIDGMKGGQWVLHFPPEASGSATYDFLRPSRYGKSYFSQWMTRGAVACSLSHLSILQDALTSGYETIWIFEDDLLVRKDPRLIGTYIETLDSLVGLENWDVLFTDDCPAIGEDQRPEKKSFWFLWRPDVAQYDYVSYAERTCLTPEILKIGSRNRTHSMVVRRSGIKKILEFELRCHLFLPYDNELTLIPTLQRYTLTFPLVTYRGGFSSDVQEN